MRFKNLMERFEYIKLKIDSYDKDLNVQLINDEKGPYESVELEAEENEPTVRFKVIFESPDRKVFQYQCDKGFSTGIHEHFDEHEEIFMIKGQMIDHLNGKITSEKESYYVQANKPHNLEMLTDGEMTIITSKVKDFDEIWREGK